MVGLSRCADRSKADKYDGRGERATKASDVMDVNFLCFLADDMVYMKVPRPLAYVWAFAGLRSLVD